MPATVVSQEQGESPAISTLEAALRDRIQALSYLPTTAVVAMKFVELGRDPESGPNEYAKVIASDASLSTKLLALSNSSWFGVRQRVTQVPMAVSLLGLCNVRALALSHCMTGLHHELNLTHEESLPYWQAGLCKAITARRFVQSLEPSMAEVAFAAGIFQDFALTVMHAVEKGQPAAAPAGTTLTPSRTLVNERERFGMDHAEAGRMLGQKLELPDIYTDAIAFHHDSDSLHKFCESDALADGVFMAGLMPHGPAWWHGENIRQGKELFEKRLPNSVGGWDAFLMEIQKELDELFSYFQNGQVCDLKLKEMVSEATEEMADTTTLLVGRVNQMMVTAADQGKIVHEVLCEKEALEDRVMRDPLTGLLNRDGFTTKASEVLARAGRYRAPVTVVFIDLDGFKSVNDTHGHPFGDFVLREAAARMSSVLGHSVVLGRLGGDEFAAVFADLSREQVQAKLADLLTASRQPPYVKGKVSVAVTWSVGAVWLSSASPDLNIEVLLKAADESMYSSKRRKADGVSFRVL